MTTRATARTLIGRQRYGAVASAVVVMSLTSLGSPVVPIVSGQSVSNAAPPVDGGWPRSTTTATGANLVIYQPQIASCATKTWLKAPALQGPWNYAGSLLDSFSKLSVQRPTQTPATTDASRTSVSPATIGQVQSDSAARAAGTQRTNTYSRLRSSGAGGCQQLSPEKRGWQSAE